MQLVSVIVPVYNVEKFIDVCISSIVRQTYKNIEIILVDDGSTDNSGAICNEWSNKDRRIRVLHKENGGLSDARNEGIKAAKGEYIVFVDSDDFISENLVQYCLGILEEEDVDIVAYGYQRVEENCNMWVEDWEKKKEVIESLTGKELLKEFLKNGKGDVVVWNKFYKREIWKELRFPYGKIHEDGFVIVDVMLAAQKAVVSNHKLYYYRQRKGSIMSQRNTKTCYDALKAHREWCKKVQFDEEMYILALRQYYGSLITVFTYENDRKRKRLLKKEYRDKFHPFLIFKYDCLKTAITYMCFYISPYLYYAWGKMIRVIKKFLKIKIITDR